MLDWDDFLAAKRAKLESLNRSYTDALKRWGMLACAVLYVCGVAFIDVVTGLSGSVASKRPQRILTAACAPQPTVSRAGVEVFEGRGRVADPHTVDLGDGRRFTVGI